jgi:hypothetical protein
VSAVALEFADWLYMNDGSPKPDIASSLTYRQVVRSIAVHEAAHAVVGLAYDMSLKRAGVLEWTEGDRRFATGRTSWNNCFVPELRYAVMCAAGARADLRHLRAAGLLTAQTARGAADSGTDDRRTAVTALAASRFPLRDSGARRGMWWTEVEQMADAAVGRLWKQITAVADAMVAGGVLTGDRIAALACLPNPAPEEAAQ